MSAFRFARRTRRFFACAAPVVSSVFVFFAMLKSWNKTGFGDWQWFHHQWEVAHVAAWRFHEIALFDPFHCGGVSMLGNPQLQTLSPTYWLTGGLFGTTIGHKVFVLGHSIVGYLGMRTWMLRTIRVGEIAAHTSAFVFVASGFFVWHIGGGHASFAPLYFAPLVADHMRRARLDLRHAGVVGLLIGLSLFEGGHYATVFLAMLAGFEAVALAMNTGVRFRAVAALAIAGVVTITVGAVRWLPVTHALAAHPRPGADNDALKLKELFAILTDRGTQARWSFEGHQWVWPEYAAYVGVATLALAAVGGLLAIRRRRAWLLFGALIAGSIAMGRFHELAPWPLLTKLPVLTSMHVPSRFRVFLILYLAALAGLAIDALGARWLARTRLRGLRFVTVLLALGVGAYVVHDVAHEAGHSMRAWDGGELPRGTQERNFHLTLTWDYLGEYAAFPHRNVGTQSCYDPLPWDVASGLWLGDVAQARFSAGSGEVIAFARTTNRVRVELDARGTSTLILNQNFDGAWRATLDGRPVRLVDQAGLASVRDVPTGRHVLVLDYAPRDFWAPLAVSGLATALVLGWIVIGRRTRRYATTS